MFRRLDEEYGRLDVLVNIPGAGYLSHPEDIPVAQFTRVPQGTLVGKFICCQAAGRRMLPPVQGQHSQHVFNRWHTSLGTRQLRL